MNKGILYSNGVIASLSQSLLSKDFLNRLLECNTVEDMQNMLEETSYGFSPEESTMQEKTHIETTKIIEFVKNESPDDKFTQFFLLPFDYENIQTFCKCLMLNLDAQNFIQVEGLYSFDEIKNNIAVKNYSNFKNNFIVEALTQFDKLSQDRTLSGWEIEYIFKKQMYANLLKISNALLTNLVKTEITIENISVASRARTQFELESQMLNGGYLNKNELLLIFKKDKSILHLNKNEEILPFIKLALGEKTTDNVVNFEKNKQNFKVKYFYERKDDIETISPFAYYCYKKLVDIKNVRMAYSYMENGLNNEIKKRVLNSGK